MNDASHRTASLSKNAVENFDRETKAIEAVVTVFHLSLLLQVLAGFVGLVSAQFGYFTTRSNLAPNFFIATLFLHVLLGLSAIVITIGITRQIKKLFLSIARIKQIPFTMHPFETILWALAAAGGLILIFSVYFLGIFLLHGIRLPPFYTPLLFGLTALGMCYPLFRMKQYCLNYFELTIGGHQP
jgi:hypothetical protein